GAEADDLKGLVCTRELLEAAEDAAKAWADVAAQLKAKVEPAAPTLEALVADQFLYVTQRSGAESVYATTSGKIVSRKTAQQFMERAVPNEDGLFPGCSQTWRIESKGTSNGDEVIEAGRKQVEPADDGIPECLRRTPKAAAS